MVETSVDLNQHLTQVKMHFYFFLFHCLFPVEYIFTNVVESQISNRKYLLGLIKRRAKVYQTNMSREHCLKF